MSRIGLPEMLIVFLILMLLFGARRLPELARSLGKSAKELRRGMQDDTTSGDSSVDASKL